MCHSHTTGSTTALRFFSFLVNVFQSQHKRYIYCPKLQLRIKPLLIMTSFRILIPQHFERLAVFD